MSGFAVNLTRDNRMPENQADDKSEEFERLLHDQQHSQYVLRLYVTGLTTLLLLLCLQAFVSASWAMR